jgi:hypothetical protein
VPYYKRQTDRSVRKATARLRALCLPGLAALFALSGPAGAELVERRRVIETFEFPSPASVQPGSEQHLSFERTAESSGAGKWSLKLQCAFDTDKQEKYGLLLCRPVKREPLRVGLQLKGADNGAAIAPIVSWVEEYTRRWLVLGKPEPVESEAWRRVEFDLSSLKTPKRSDFRLEGFEVSESPDPGKNKEKSSVVLFLDEIDAISLVPADLPWQVTIDAGMEDSVATESEGGVSLYAQADFFTEPAPKDVRLVWEVRDASPASVASGNESIGEVHGRYVVREIRFKTGDSTGPYVAVAKCCLGDPAETAKERTLSVSDPKLTFKFVLPKESNQTKLTTGFVQSKDRKQFLRAQYAYSKGTGPRRDHFSLLLPEDAFMPTARLRSVTLRINVADIDQGFNDSRAALVIRDASGSVLVLPEISLITITDWKEITWDIPDWESGLVRFPVRIEEIRFLETGSESWGNMQAGCQGAFDIDWVRLSYDEFAQLRFSVPNCRTNKTDFSNVMPLNGETFTYGATEADGHGDKACLGVGFKGAAGQHNVRACPDVPGNPIEMSFWAKTAMPNVSVRPAFSHKGHWAVARELPVEWKKVKEDGNWQRMEWRIPFSGTGLSGETAWPHVLVLPLRLEQFEVQVPARSEGQLLIDDISYLVQLPVQDRLSVSVQAREAPGDGGLRTFLDGVVANFALKRTEAKLAYSLLDAHGTEARSGAAEASLEPGQSLRLDLSKVDLGKTEGPYRLSVQTTVPGQAQTSRQEQTVFVPNARTVLLDFDQDLFLEGAVQTEEARKEGRFGVEIDHPAGRVQQRVTGFQRVLPGCPVQLGLWVKGSRNHLFLSFSGHDRGPNVTNFTTNPVLVDWEGWRHVTFELPKGVFPPEKEPTTPVIDYPVALTTMTLDGQPSEPGKVCIDELSVVTQSPPSELLDVGLHFGLPSRIAVVGEEQQAFVENRSLTKPLNALLRFEESPPGSEGAAARSAEIRVSLAPGERKIVSLGSRFDRAGPFQVRWRLLSDGKETLFEKDENYLAMRLSPEQLAQFSRIISSQYELYRLGSVTSDTFLLDWNKIEPYPGDMSYDANDAEVANLAGTCPGVVGRLGYTTFWNSPRGIFFPQYGFWEGDAYQYPNDLKAWYNYVYETVRRYKGRLTHWEVWNEPDKAQDEIDMLLSKYLRLLQIASAAIRQANPNARIIMGSLGSGGMRDYLEQFLKEGGGKWVDIVGLHPVDGVLGPEISFLAERVSDAVERVRKYHPKAEVWVSSLVWPSSPDGTGGALPEHVQADYMARGKVLCLAAGANRVLDQRMGVDAERSSSITVYQVRPRKIVPSFSQLDPWPNWYLKPSFLAVKTVNQVLEGAKYREEVLLADHCLHYARCYLFDTGKDEVMASLWRREGVSALDLSRIAAPRRGLDAYGNDLDLRSGKVQLTPSPCYLYFGAPDAARLAGALAVEPLAFKDHDDSLWKQKLLDWLDRSAERLNSHRYAVQGQVSEYQATGKYQADVNLNVKAAKVTGAESYEADISRLGTDDLLILRRVDLSLPSQRVALKVDEAEVGRYDLAPLERVTKHSTKRFYDVPLVVPNVTLKGKNRVRIEFAGTAEGQKSPDAAGKPEGAAPQPFSSILTRFYAKPTGPLYLSDVDYVAAQQSQSALRMDENVVGQTIRILDQTYAKGLGTHAKSQIVYYLGGQFRRLQARPGLDQSVEEGSVTFLVLADGKTAYESKGPVTAYSKAEPVEIDVSGCQVLELRVGDADDGIQGDWACWAEARLVR